MRKIVAAINVTLNGFCNHTVGIPDKDLHKHYPELIRNADAILYGRITYQLMQFWQTLVKNPSGKKSIDDFALAIDKIPKIVFSRTLKDTHWANAQLADHPIEEEVLKLKQSSDSASKDILVGSRSLIIQLMNLNLIDEYQLYIHPVVIGKGLPLFENTKDSTVFNLMNTKTFRSGVVIHYYESAKRT